MMKMKRFLLYIEPEKIARAAFFRHVALDAERTARMSLSFIVRFSSEKQSSNAVWLSVDPVDTEIFLSLSFNYDISIIFDEIHIAWMKN